MSPPDYRWGAGLGLALGSLKNVFSELYPYNVQYTGQYPARFGVVSPLFNPFPVRFKTGSGRENGGGIKRHEWNMVITTYAFDFVADTYFSGGTVVSVPMTIYTRYHQHNSYFRANAYMVYPSSDEGDLEYINQNVMRVRFRFDVVTPL